MIYYHRYMNSSVDKLQDYFINEFHSETPNFLINLINSPNTYIDIYLIKKT